MISYNLLPCFHGYKRFLLPLFLLFYQPLIFSSEQGLSVWGGNGREGSIQFSECSWNQKGTSVQDCEADFNASHEKLRVFEENKKITLRYLDEQPDEYHACYEVEFRSAGSKGSGCLVLEKTNLLKMTPNQVESAIFLYGALKSPVEETEVEPGGVASDVPDFADQDRISVQFDVTGKVMLFRSDKTGWSFALPYSDLGSVSHASIFYDSWIDSEITKVANEVVDACYENGWDAFLLTYALTIIACLISKNEDLQEGVFYLGASMAHSSMRLLHTMPVYILTMRYEEILSTKREEGLLKALKMAEIN